MSETGKLSEMQLDALQEISNIGLGHAATSLAEMLESRIGMGVPRTSFVTFEKVIDIIGGYEELISCVSLQLAGDIKGIVFYIFNEKSTYSLVDMLMDLEDGTTVELDEMATSTINEIGNILTGSFISAITDFTNLSVTSSTPIFAFDMLAAVFTSLVIESGRSEGDNILTIETQLFRDDQKVSGYFFLMPEPESIKRLLLALGIEA
ncbi:chemotaxis protein CheC [Desulfoscipio sp. XC116]|uniref:chemotaxis protein CheC n=1 Tax=Desulfoscipio sp. XC116 TaxID=3144975 RepID=UPI00325AE2D6